MTNRITIDIDDLPENTEQEREFKINVQSAAEVQQLAYHEQRAARLRDIRGIRKAEGAVGVPAPGPTEGEVRYAPKPPVRPGQSYGDTADKKNPKGFHPIGSTGTIVLQEDEPELTDEERALLERSARGKKSGVTTDTFQPERAGDDGTVDVMGVRTQRRR